VSSKAVPAQASASTPGARLGAPTPATAQLADRFGALDVQVQRFKPTAKLQETLRKEIQALYDASPPEQDFVLKGDLFEIQIGPRENERKITSMAKLLKAITQKVFLDHCGFPMKIIDALLPGDKQKDLVATARTGTRAVKAIPLASTQEKSA